jgi:hypothetical protein
MSYTNGGQTIDKSMNGIISYDTGDGVVIEGGTVTAENVLATDITCDNLQVNTSATFSGTATFNTALPTSTITTTTNGNQFITKNIGDALYSGGSILGSNNTWTGQNYYNTVLPTSTKTGTPTATQIAPLQMLNTVLAPQASPTFTGTVTLPNTTCNYNSSTNNSTLYFAGFSNNYIRNTGNDGSTATNCNLEIGCWNGLGFRDLGVSNTVKIFFDVRSGLITTTFLAVTNNMSIGGTNIYSLFGRLTTGITNAWLSTNTFNAVLPTSTLTGTPASTAIAPVSMLANVFAPLTGSTVYASLTANNIFTGINNFDTQLPRSTITSTTVDTQIAPIAVLRTLFAPLNGSTVYATIAGNNAFSGLNRFDTQLPRSTVTTLSTVEQIAPVAILDTRYAPITGSTVYATIAGNNAFSGLNRFDTQLPRSTVTTSFSTQDIAPIAILDTRFAPISSSTIYAKLASANTFSANNTFSGATTEFSGTNTNFTGTTTTLRAGSTIVQSKVNGANSQPTLYVRNADSTHYLNFLPCATNNAYNLVVDLSDNVIASSPADTTLALVAQSSTSKNAGIRILGSTGDIQVQGTTTSIISSATYWSDVDALILRNREVTPTNIGFIVFVQSASLKNPMVLSGDNLIYSSTARPLTLTVAGTTATGIRIAPTAITLNSTTTTITSATSGASAVTALTVRNADTTGTFAFLPNATGTTLNPLVQTGDCVIASGPSNTTNLTLTTNSSTNVGIRIVRTGFVDMRGTTTTVISNATTTTATEAFIIQNSQTPNDSRISFLIAGTASAVNPMVLAGDNVIFSNSNNGTLKKNLVLTYYGTTATGIRINGSTDDVEVIGTTSTLKATTTNITSTTTTVSGTTTNLSATNLVVSSASSFSKPIGVGYGTAPTFTDAQIGYTFESAQLTWDGGTANQVYQSPIITIPRIGLWRVDAYLRVYSGNTCRYTFSIAPYNLLPTHAINRVTYDVARLEATPSSIYMMTTYTKFHATGTMLCGTVSATDTNLLPPLVPYTYGMYYVLTRVA